MMGYLEFLHSSRMICLIFQKNCIDNNSLKRQKGHTLIAFIFVNTVQYPHILKNNIYHSNKWRPSPFFHSDTNPVLGHFIVYCGIDWLLFLNILSFNFVQTPNKSLKPPCCCSNQSYTAFLLDVRWSKWLRSLFFQLFVPNNNAVA